MIVMLDTSHKLDKAEAEIGYPVEQLFTPSNWHGAQRPDAHFAIDNGAFARFDEEKFQTVLKRHEKRRELCRFVTVPDVVGSARRTLEVFGERYHDLCRWPLALVCQDGQEDLPIPWYKIDAIFIGGTTKWKESDAAIACIKAAQAIGKWVHVGRVNDPSRFEAFEQLGVDSVDGSGLAQYSWMRERIATRNGDHRLFSKSELVGV
jgi:hypothetical protein